MALCAGPAVTTGAAALVPMAQVRGTGLPRLAAPRSIPPGRPYRRALVVAVTSGDGKKTASSTTTTVEEVEAVTKKWGLEAGLWKALSSRRVEPGQEEGEGEGEVQPGAAREPEAGPPAAEEPTEAKAKSSTEVAKELLAKYGVAYLATSISLALVSFSFCYVLVDRGVDVASLLKQAGLEVDGTGETVGTLAIAYAAHKAASPIRFPPTVLLTPIVANFLGKKGKGEDE